MNAANPTSPDPDIGIAGGLDGSPTARLEIEARDPRSLSLWQGHLRDLLLEARGVVGKWQREAIAERLDLSFLPELADLVDPHRARGTARRIAARRAPGLILLHRCATRWESLAHLGELAAQMPPLAPERILRSLHLYTDYRLTRRRLLRRRNAALHVAELQLHPADEDRAATPWTPAH